MILLGYFTIFSVVGAVVLCHIASAVRNHWILASFDASAPVMDRANMKETTVLLLAAPAQTPQRMITFVVADLPELGDDAALEDMVDLEDAFFTQEEQEPSSNGGVYVASADDADEIGMFLEDEAPTPKKVVDDGFEDEEPTLSYEDGIVLLDVPVDVPLLGENGTRLIAEVATTEATKQEVVPEQPAGNANITAVVKIA